MTMSSTVRNAAYWTSTGLAALALGATGAADLRRVKEWAYAGMSFTLTGAALSHAASGDPIPGR